MRRTAKINILKVSTILGLLLVFMLNGNNVWIKAQATVSTKELSSETYRKVIEKIFPREVADFGDPTKEFALTLRFFPPDKPGAQISVTKHRDGKIKIITYALPNGGKSIGDQIDAIVRHRGKTNAEEIATLLNVEERMLKDTTAIRQLMDHFAVMRISAKLDTFVTLDGTSFHIWYEAVSNESYHSLVGGEPGNDSNDHPLVRWVNELRQAVLK